MGYVRWCLLGVLCAMLYKYYRGSPLLAVRVEGFVAPGFEKVIRVFRQNFEQGFDTIGASFSAYHKGELVVDLHGGYRTASDLMPWTNDTIGIFFSATKTFTSLALAWLVDKGFVKYEDEVIQFWPEFGRHGKGNATVDWLVNHRVGLAYLDSDITCEAVMNGSLMSKKIEDTYPQWPPGTKSGYHGFTVGFLVDQIIRRVDPNKRTLAQLVRDEFTNKYQLQFYIGLNKTEHWRLSPVQPPFLSESLAYALTDKMFRSEFLATLKTMMPPTQLYTGFVRNMAPILDMSGGDPAQLTSYEYMRLEIGAANGAGTTGAAAKLFSLVGEGVIIEKDLVNRLSEPTWTGIDQLLGLQVSRGYGFMHTRSALGDWQFGHPGVGGQMIKLDAKQRLSMAYLTNKMKGTVLYSPAYNRLEEALYECIAGST